MEGASSALAYGGCFSRPAGAVLADLERFAQILLKWNQAQNLVSRETERHLWSRHIADSLQVLNFLKQDDRSFLDLGSGGGFPAIPLAIALKGSRRRFILVEPIAKKASFLRAVSRQLELDLRVEAKRSTQLDSRETGEIDVITSRALAPLPALLGLAAPFFGPKTRALFHKGREHVDELAESAALWHYDVVIEKSDTDGAGVLLDIRYLRSRTTT